MSEAAADRAIDRFNRSEAARLLPHMRRVRRRLWVTGIVLAVMAVWAVYAALAVLP
jgi:4-hydroxybenzoate polyprenyltransferase